MPFLKLTSCVPGMTHQQFRRLARRGGVKRMGITASTRSALGNEIRSSLKLYLERIVHEAIEYSGHDYRSTITCRDVGHALKRNGATMYGCG
ncbi:histone H4 [Mycena galericulata]|nr:histone H4 [Mycena galericulata]